MKKEELMSKANSLSILHKEKKDVISSMLDEMDLRLKDKNNLESDYFFGMSESISTLMNEIEKIEEEYADIIDEIKKIK